MRTLCHFQLKTGEPRKDLGPFQTAKLRDILDERKGGHEDARRARGRDVVPSPSESGPGPLLASWLPFSLPSESFRYFFKPAHVGGKCTSWNKTEYRKKHQRGAAERVGDRGQCGRGGRGVAEQGAGDLGSHGVATECRNGDPDGHERRAAGKQSLSGSSLPPPHSQYKFLRQRKKLQSCPGGEGEEQGPPRKGPPGRLLSGRQSVRPHRGVRVFVG